MRIWGASRIFWFYFVLSGLFPAAIGIVVLVAGALEKNGTAPFVTGIVVCSFSLPLATFAVASARPLTIAEGRIRIPKGFRTSVVDLTTLAGVGLLYRFTVQSQNPVGWTLCVWDGAGAMIPIPRLIVVAWSSTSAPGVKHRYLATTRDWTLPLAHEDSTYLATSKAGRAAIRIYEAAQTYQHKRGPLTTRALEKREVFNPDAMTQTAAWWSPDGTMGRTKGLPLPQWTAEGDPVGGGPRAPGPSPSSTIAAPVASPEVRHARRTNRRLGLAILPIFIIAGAGTSLLLGHTHQLANGQVCASVLGPAPIRPSGGCDVWRHHQLTIFIGSGIVIGLITLTLVVLQIRALKIMHRLSRANDPGRSFEQPSR
jgi:hypothetical protein